MILDGGTLAAFAAARAAFHTHRLRDYPIATSPRLAALSHRQAARCDAWVTWCTACDVLELLAMHAPRRQAA